MLCESFCVSYKNIETNLRNSPREITGSKEFDSSDQFPNRHGLIDFHINYEPTKDVTSKDQAISLKHYVQVKSNTFTVTDKTKSNKKVNI